MCSRWKTSPAIRVLVAIAFFSILQSPLTGQAPGAAADGRAAAGERANVPRTPWGDPDLQGTWDFTTITPLQRPAVLAKAG